MADVFCLCDTRNPSRGRFADRIISLINDALGESIDTNAIVVLGDRARCVKTGAKQVTPDGHLAFPNVDIYRCLNCGAEFTVLMGQP